MIAILQNVTMFGPMAHQLAFKWRGKCVQKSVHYFGVDQNVSIFHNLNFNAHKIQMRQSKQKTRSLLRAWGFVNTEVV